jgi:hypothetical protein
VDGIIPVSCVSCFSSRGKSVSYMLRPPLGLDKAKIFCYFINLHSVSELIFYKIAFCNLVPLRFDVSMTTEKNLIETDKTFNLRQN